MTTLHPHRSKSFEYKITFLEETSAGVVGKRDTDEVVHL
jgi:hypothetical protein